MDTGPLLSALILDYVRNSPRPRRDSILANSRIASYLSGDETLQRCFLRLFDTLQTILTTSNVIGEIQGLQTLKGHYQREFWLGGIRLLRQKRLDEKLLRILDMELDDTNRELMQVLGPTDTGLLQLAKNEGCYLLTDDNALRSQARQEGIDCRLAIEMLREVAFVSWLTEQSGFYPDDLLI